jgi:hypothetical protein
MRDGKLNRKTSNRLRLIAGQYISNVCHIQMNDMQVKNCFCFCFPPADVDVDAVIYYENENIVEKEENH